MCVRVSDNVHRTWRQLGRTHRHDLNNTGFWREAERRRLCVTLQWREMQAGEMKSRKKKWRPHWVCCTCCCLGAMQKAKCFLKSKQNLKGGWGEINAEEKKLRHAVLARVCKRDNKALCGWRQREARTKSPNNPPTLHEAPPPAHRLKAWNKADVYYILNQPFRTATQACWPPPDSLFLLGFCSDHNKSHTHAPSEAITALPLCCRMAIKERSFAELETWT